MTPVWQYRSLHISNLWHGSSQYYIDHFCENINNLTNALATHIMIIPDLRYNLFKSYKVFEDINFREYLI